ncbi:hypothetical protein, partial [Rhodoblastus sp.]|uniref:hypothetical protein n=1 Tax=Rhodoblastus sp. TaxID=1962975 RepID=UPI0035B29D6E
FNKVSNKMLSLGGPRSAFLSPPLGTRSTAARSRPAAHDQRSLVKGNGSHVNAAGPRGPARTAFMAKISRLTLRPFCPENPVNVPGQT